MTKFLLISGDSEKEKIVMEVFPADEVIVSADETMIFDVLKVEEPDIVIVDGDIETLDLKPLCRKIKQYPVVIILLLGEKDHGKDVMHNANLFIKTPIDKKLLFATVDSSLKTRHSLLKMTKANQELARSLYQLNVLYNTSSQLAGSLDKDKLIKIMIEGIEKSLNFELSCTLMFRSEREPVLIINSLYKVSDRLLEALKLRAILSYKSLLSDPPVDIKIGNFVEVKNSDVDDGTKLPHLIYCGDSDLGKNVNFGCGTVTVNFDGKNKHRCTIDEHAFIGCNTNLVAPVHVGTRAFTAAGSTITKDVPAKALAVGRAKQVNIENWVKEDTYKD